MFVFGGWAWTKRAAKRQPAANPLLTILVPAMLDDTHRAAMRAPSRLGKIDNLLADQRLQRPARHGFARQPFDPHTLFGLYRTRFFGHQAALCGLLRGDRCGHPVPPGLGGASV